MKRVDWKFQDEFKEEFIRVLKRGSLGNMIEYQIHNLLNEAEVSILRQRIDEEVEKTK